MTTHYAQPVACIRGADGVICGTGWLALGRYVVTCAHVLDDALKRTRGTVEWPDSAFQVDLPFLGKAGPARVVAWYPWRPLADLVRDNVADIAVLELELEAGKTLGGGLEQVAVDRRIPPRGTHFLTYGFPKGYDNGVEASGEVLVEDPGGWLHVRDTQGFGYFIQPGFSGAPVLNQADLRLIGMATAADRDKATRLAFLLPIQTICRAFPRLAQPYRGLFPFEEENADLFFGRDGFISELRGKLDRHPFAAVIGPSGSGKSSVVLAGLLPKLTGWNIAVCRPLRDPLRQVGLSLAPLLGVASADFDKRNQKAEEWAGRLREDPERIVDLARETGKTAAGRQARTLLVIDQFEELFTNDADAPDGGVARKDNTTPEDGSPRQAQFLAVLEAIARQDPDSSPIRAVATMRADFMGAALGIRRLAGLLKDSDVKLGPMTAAELNEAVRRPARTFGVEFEEGLAEELVTAMLGRAGGLPLLQFALDRLWRRQERRTLTGAAYRGADGNGGLESALDEHAREVMRRLGEAAKPGLRRLMLRLVKLGEDGAPDARAVVRRHEIGDADWPLAQKLADERLLMIGRDPAGGEEIAEVVHEALIGGWGQLHEWLVEDRAFGLWRQGLKASLEAWSVSPEEELLRGRRLTEAANWLETNRDDLNTQECSFIKASQTHAKQVADEKLRQAEERERIAKELASTRGRMNNRLLAAIALLLIALAAGGYFYWDNSLQRARAQLAENRAVAAAEQAETARLEAEAFAREAKGRQLGIEATRIERDLQGASTAERAAALAIEGWRRLPTTAAFQAAATAVRELPIHRFEHSGGLDVVAFSPKGSLMATAGAGTVRLMRTADGREVSRTENDRKITSAAFSPDGTQLVTGSGGGSARIIRTADGSEVAHIEHTGRVNAVVFSPNGSLLATGSDDGSALLVRTTNGSKVARIEHGGGVNAVAFSPDGSLLATGSGLGDSGRVRLIRATDGSEVARIQHKFGARTVAFSPKGDLLATISDDNSVRLIRTIDGRWVALIRHLDVINAIAFSPNGELLATASDDDNARLIRTTDGSELARIQHNHDVNAVAFNPTGDLLATGSNDGGARLIRTSDGSDMRHFQQGGPVLVVAFSPKSDLLVTGSDDRSARLIRIADSSEIARVEHDGRVTSVVFSSQNDLLLTGADSRSGSARLIPTIDGCEAPRIEHDGLINAVAFNPNSAVLATGGRDGAARLIRIADGREVARTEHIREVTAVAFNPNGELLAIGSNDNSVRLIRTDDGSESFLMQHNGPINAVAFNGGGDLLATGSEDRSVRLILTADGREVARFAHDGAVRAVAFNAKGDLLATGSADGNARLIRIADNREVARIAHDGTVQAVAFRPQGDLLATASKDSVRLIQTADGREAARIEHGGGVEAVAYSPDGDLLATGSKDSLRLFRTADNSEVARIEDGSAIHAIAFSPKGNLIATVSLAGSVRLWLSPQRLFETLCRERAGRNLSVEEWTRHIGPAKDWAPTCPEWPSDKKLLAAWQAKHGGGQK